MHLIIFAVMDILSFYQIIQYRSNMYTVDSHSQPWQTMWFWERLHQASKQTNKQTNK